MKQNDEDRLMEMVNAHHMDSMIKKFVNEPDASDKNIPNFVQKSVKRSDRICKNVEVPKKTRKRKASSTKLKVAIAGVLIAATTFGIGTAIGLKVHDTIDYYNARNAVMTQLRENMGVETLPPLGKDLEPEEQAKNIDQISDIIVRMAEDYHLPYKKVEENGHEFITFEDVNDQHKMIYLLYSGSESYEDRQNNKEQASKYFGKEDISSYLKYYGYTEQLEYGERIPSFIVFENYYGDIIDNEIERVKNFEFIREGSK